MLQILSEKVFGTQKPSPNTVSEGVCFISILININELAIINSDHQICWLNKYIFYNSVPARKSLKRKALKFSLRKS